MRNEKLGFPKEDQMQKMSLRISAEDKAAITKYAKENDLSVSQVVRRMIREFLEKDYENYEK